MSTHHKEKRKKKSKKEKYLKLDDGLNDRFRLQSNYSRTSINQNFTEYTNSNSNFADFAHHKDSSSGSDNNIQEYDIETNRSRHIRLNDGIDKAPSSLMLHPSTSEKRKRSYSPEDDFFSIEDRSVTSRTMTSNNRYDSAPVNSGSKRKLRKTNSSHNSNKYEMNHNDKSDKDLEEEGREEEDDDDDEPSQNIQNSCSSKKISSYCSDTADSDNGSSPTSPMNNNTNVDHYSVEDPTVHYSTKVSRMMKNMGYKKGKGLGLNEQGLTAPIKESTQKGRRGLGLTPVSVTKEVDYDSEKEICTAEETPSWLVYDETKFNDSMITDGWVVVGTKKLTIDDETNFCDKLLLKKLLCYKSMLDKVPDNEKRKATGRANLFEKIKNCIFLNRAAVKMANMDAVFDYMFTKPRDPNNAATVPSNQLLYFADVCAGPGGFSEYVLWRRKWRAKGFGFTLKDAHDFDLENFYAGPCESFEPYYGVLDDGNIYRPENIESFEKFVLRETDGKGVHFMMADGGFSVAGKENIQEILSKRLYLCQCLVAINIVRAGGHFVCKLFDVFTQFSASLVYLMYLSFQKISIHKPRTSRPANSERYLICKWKNQNTRNVQNILYNMNLFMENHENTDNDIISLVPLKLMKADQKFFNYLYNSNNTLAELQINSLAKVLKYIGDETLSEEDKQIRLKNECLSLWDIPSDVRKEPCRDEPSIYCRKIFDNNTEFISKLPTFISEKNVSLSFKSFFPIYDWHVTFLSSNKPTFFVSNGRKRCFEFDRGLRKWVQVNADYNLELSPYTLLYGEIANEMEGESSAQRRIPVLHIIDAHILGGFIIYNFHYTERIKMCESFAKSITKRSTTMLPVRMKTVVDLEYVEKMFDPDTLKPVTMKKYGVQKGFFCNPTENQYFIPKGMMFLKATKLPYKRFYSEKTKHKYYDAKGAKSKYDDHRPREAISDFRTTYCESCVYNCTNDETKIELENPFVRYLIDFVRKAKYTKNFDDIKFMGH